MEGLSSVLQKSTLHALYEDFFTLPWSACDFSSFFPAIRFRSEILLLQKFLDLLTDLFSVFCTKWCPAWRQNLEYDTSVNASGN